MCIRDRSLPPFKKTNTRALYPSVLAIDWLALINPATPNELDAIADAIAKRDVPRKNERRDNKCDPQSLTIL